MLFGCSATPPYLLKKPIERQRIFNISKEKLWDIIIRGLLEEGEIITFTDRKSGIIIIKYPITVNESTKYIIGNVFGATGGTAIINIGLQGSDENKTIVFVNAKITLNLVNQYGFSAGIKNYISNGKLEEKYLNLISARCPEKRKEYKWLEENKTKK